MSKQLVAKCKSFYGSQIEVWSEDGVIVREESHPCDGFLMHVYEDGILISTEEYDDGDPMQEISEEIALGFIYP